jgi:hypothetical protein
VFEWRQRAREVAGDRALNLDDVGAMIAQQPSCERTGNAVTEVKHSQPSQGAVRIYVPHSRSPFWLRVITAFTELVE